MWRFVWQFVTSNSMTGLDHQAYATFKALFFRRPAEMPPVERRVAVHWGKPLICSLENYIWGHCTYKLFLVWHLTGVLTLVWLCVSSTYSHVPAFFYHFSHSLGRCHQSGWLATGTSLAVPALPGALCLRSLSTAGWSHPGCGRWGAGPLEGWEDENSHGRPGLFDVDVEQLLISYSHWLLAFVG